MSNKQKHTKQTIKPDWCKFATTAQRCCGLQQTTNLHSAIKYNNSSDKYSLWHQENMRRYQLEIRLSLILVVRQSHLILDHLPCVQQYLECIPENKYPGSLAHRHVHMSLMGGYINVFPVYPGRSQPKSSLLVLGPQI